MWYLDSRTCLRQAVHTLPLSSLVPQCPISHRNAYELSFMEAIPSYLPPFNSSHPLTLSSLQLFSSFNSVLPLTLVMLWLSTPFNSRLSSTLSSLQLLGPFDSPFDFELPSTMVTLWLSTPFDSCFYSTMVTLQLVTPFESSQPWTLRSPRLWGSFESWDLSILETLWLLRACESPIIHALLTLCPPSPRPS